MGKKNSVKRKYGICGSGLPASLTVETALCFPLFLFAVLTLCYLFVYMETGLTVRECMAETAREISAYGDLIKNTEDLASENIESAADSTDSFDIEQAALRYMNGAPLVKLSLTEQLMKYPLIEQAVMGGASGVSCEGSFLFDEDECIRINCAYKIKLPFSFVYPVGISAGQSLEYRYFTGHKVASLLEETERPEVEEQEEIVYKTETGKVYHVKLSCPSLKLSVSEVAAKDVSGKRNAGGGKYYACEKCAKGEAPTNLYITTDGDRYHYTVSCSGLKRTVKEVKKSTIPNFRPCKRCRKE